MKDTARLVAAYDDAAGVTAEFNRNVLRVLAAAGLELTHWWTDAAGDFALSLSRLR